MNIFPNTCPVPEEDWSFWFLRPEIHAWEAAALVCDLDPNWLYAGQREDGTWLFDMPEWEGAQKPFETIFTLICENGRVEGFHRPQEKVNFKEFVIWATTKTNWELPKAFKEHATKSLPELLSEENHKRILSPKQITNELKLIGALLEVILDKSALDSQAKLISYLDAEYKDLGGFSISHLEMKFSQANAEFKGSKLSRDS